MGCWFLGQKGEVRSHLFDPQLLPCLRPVWLPGLASPRTLAGSAFGVEAGAGDRERHKEAVRGGRTGEGRQVASRIWGDSPNPPWDGLNTTGLFQGKTVHLPPPGD